VRSPAVRIAIAHREVELGIALQQQHAVCADAATPVAETREQRFDGLGEVGCTVVDEPEKVARTVHFEKLDLHTAQGTPRGRCNTSTTSLMSSAGSTRIPRASLAGSSSRFHCRFRSRSRNALTHHRPGSSASTNPPWPSTSVVTRRVLSVSATAYTR